MRPTRDSNHQNLLPSTRRVAVLLDLTLLAFFFWHAFYLLRSPLTYAPDDALFYYQIGFNASHGEGVRFNDLTPTNGFHPLWLGVCTLLGFLCTTKLQLMTLGTLTVILLNGIAALMIRRFLRDECGDWLASVGALLAVPYLFFVAHGMEGSLAAALFTTLLFAARDFIKSPKPAKFVACAALCGLVVAARLDLIFFVAPIALLVAWKFRHAAHAPRWFLCASAAGMAPVATFLALNTAYFGDPRPISGILKFAASQGVGSLFLLNGIVLTYLVLSLLGALLALSRRTATSLVFVSAASGSVCFVLYLLANNHAEIGAWYFTLFAVTGALGFAYSVDAVLSHGTRLRPLFSKAIYTVAATAAIASAFLMVRYGNRGVLSTDIHQVSTGLAESARRERIHRVFAFDRPGELAFLDGLSVVAADGLTTNLPFQKELAARGLDEFLDRYEIDAVVLPRIGSTYGPALCDQVYLSALRFRCSRDDDAMSTGIRIVELEVLSRLTGASLGKLDLRNAQRIAFSPNRDLDVLLLDSRPASRAISAR